MIYQVVDILGTSNRERHQIFPRFATWEKGEHRITLRNFPSYVDDPYATGLPTNWLVVCKEKQ